MSTYIYNTTFFKNTDRVIGTDIPQNALDLVDFETNHKSVCEEVSEILFAETTINTIKSYSGFEALITGDITWGDVKLVSKERRYELYLITDNPL